MVVSYSGQTMNHFDVLELSINEIQEKDEATIQSKVTAAHRRFLVHL